MKKLTMLALLVGCSGTPRPTPAVPAAGACEPIDPATISAKPAGPGLSRLLPGRGPGTGLPMTVPQLLSMDEAPTTLQWKALPMEADAILAQVAFDENAGVPQRARAASGLAARGSEGAGPQLASLLADGRLDPTLRRTAARALGATYVGARPGGADESPALLNALADPDDLLREAVVKALGAHVDRPDIRSALEARNVVESHELVKEALSQALTPKEP